MLMAFHLSITDNSTTCFVDINALTAYYTKLIKL